jgi:hypothetical protein
MLATWLIILTCFSLSVIIWNLYYNSLFTNPFRYFTYSEVFSQKLHDIFWYPEYYQSLKNIEWPLNSSLQILLVLTAITGFTGILMKRNWGRVSSIVSLVITVVFFLLQIISLSVIPPIVDREEVFVEIIFPILVSMVFILFSILSIVYLSKRKIKETYFIKPRLEPTNITLGN